MRVALISAHTCPLAPLGDKETGGMNVYVRETAYELGKQGIGVDIFTRSQDARLPRESRLTPNIRLFHIPAGPEEPYEKYRLLVHLSEFIDGVIRFGSGDYDIIHSHYWISGAISLALRNRLNVPVIQMFHTLACVKNRVARKKDEFEGDIRHQWEQRIARSADVVIASHPEERDILVRKMGAEEKRVRVIPCGANLDLFHPTDKAEARTALGLESPALLFVGRLEPIKGLDTLLKAVKLLADKPDRSALMPKLYIVGGKKTLPDSPIEDNGLHETISGMDLQDIVCPMGPKPQEELPLYYSAASACVVPSRHESFGLVALEAMACGTPVIASDVGGLRFSVRDGRTGFLIPEGNAEVLAEKIERLLSDPTLAARFEKNALERAKRFSWKNIVSELLDVYGDLTRGPKHGARHAEGRSCCCAGGGG